MRCSGFGGISQEIECETGAKDGTRFLALKNKRKELLFIMLGKHEVEVGGRLIWFPISINISHFITEDFCFLAVPEACGDSRARD